MLLAKAFGRIISPEINGVERKREADFTLQHVAAEGDVDFQVEMLAGQTRCAPPRGSGWLVGPSFSLNATDSLHRQIGQRICVNCLC